MSAQPYYDPEVRAALEAQPSLGTINADTLEKSRSSRLLRNAEVALSDEVERVDHFVAGSHSDEVRVRVHRRKEVQSP